MTTKGHNNPPILVELSPELAQFVIKNCDSNLSMGLSIISSPDMSRKTLEKIVDQMELFKEIKKAVEAAMK